MRGELYLAGIYLVPVVSAIGCARLLLNIRDVTAMSDSDVSTYRWIQHKQPGSTAVHISVHHIAESFEMDFASTSTPLQTRHSAIKTFELDEEAASETEYVVQQTGVTNSAVGKESQWF